MNKLPYNSTPNSFNTKGNTLESLKTVLSNKRMSYAEIKEQLDLLYKDMLADKRDKTGVNVGSGDQSTDVPPSK